MPWFAIGLGSNILLPDEGLEALVIRLGKGLDRLRAARETPGPSGPGLPAPLAARRTAEAGFAGLHIFVGVPGHGRRGGLHERRLPRRRLVRGGRAGDGGGRRGAATRVLARPEIPFTYRRSGLEGRIVLETTVRLRPEEQAQLEEAVAEMFEWRQRGTPFNQPCCGSVFKNPAGPSWKQAGGPAHRGPAHRGGRAQGLQPSAGAQVSPMHANYFVNTGGATAADVRGLIEHVQKVVQERFGVQLEPEVKLIGSRGEYLNDSER